MCWPGLSLRPTWCRQRHARGTWAHATKTAVGCGLWFVEHQDRHQGTWPTGHWPSQSQPEPKFLAAPGQATRCQSKASKSPLALQRPPCPRHTRRAGSAGRGGSAVSRCSHCSIKLQDALRNAGVQGPAWGRLQQRRRSAATDSRLGTLDEIQARRLRLSAKLHSRDRASLATWPTLREPRDTRSSRPRRAQTRQK